MRNLLLLSIVLAHLIVPLWAARDRSPKRGLKKAFAALAVVDVMYVLGLRYVYWTLAS